MIRQTIVPQVLRPEVPENQTKFIRLLSESLQGLQTQVVKDNGEDSLEVMTFGPLVFFRYAGAEKTVFLPFAADAKMPLACTPPDTSGYIAHDTLLFNKEGYKIASGWCTSGGNKFGQNEKQGGE